MVALHCPATMSARDEAKALRLTDADTEHCWKRKRRESETLRVSRLTSTTDQTLECLVE